MLDNENKKTLKNNVINIHSDYNVVKDVAVTVKIKN